MTPIIHKKRFITLLEVIIAAMLTTILLTALTFFYRDMTTFNAELDKLHIVQFQQSYIQKRLSAILPKILASKPKQKDFYFFTGSPVNGSPSLVFTYDNGPCLDRDFAGHVLGRLFVDKNNALVLASWAAPSRWIEEPSLKKEVLMGDVESLHFRFYVPPEHDLSKTGPGQHLEGITYNQWYEDWPSHLKELPAMVHIRIQQKGMDKPLEFAYQLPNSNLVILYED